ncbi:PREDICTED: UPF0481 protein At3g47200-like [Fragaria vesca subsp. vesca]|uniref:UPF0481 protein At3g47200-like n=1 Tax=Fragaria vesca subsp. vesca TaxID=101020 RepID=UPI0002C2FD8D|nr:PREDICTED: UPF0481 protein At3g47200-like [Fragaria vesca subsp. vesca]
MGKGNHIFASRWFILQKITSTCKRRFHESLSCTTLPTFDAKILARGFHEVCGGGTSLTEELEDILDPEDQGWETSTNSMTCIYRVPSTMRQVNRKAFDPSIVSIGPYNYGVESLQEMEKLKHTYFRRLFQPNYHDQLDDEVAVLQKKKAVNDAKKAMEELEVVDRSCYSEQSKLNSKEFVKMMLIDGCFIIGTTCHEKPITGWELEALALRFFKPLLRGYDDVLTISPHHYAPKHCQSSSIKHFLDLFHYRISPDCSTRSVVQVPRRGKRTKQILSIQELKEAGVKLKFTTNRTCKALDITFGRGSWGWGKVLIIPRIHIADHRGTLFRNMFAFEKCDPNCHQDVTSYLFFLDSLINSAEDVGILHYYGVLHHSLGSNREVAKLVNNLCKEVSPDVSKSYLYKVVRDVNEYYGSKYGKIRGFLVHHHFSSWLVGISTLAACLALYLALVQTGSSVASARERLHEHTTFKDFLKEALLYGHISKWGLGNARNLQQKAVVSGSTENMNLPRIDMQYCIYYLI